MGWRKREHLLPTVTPSFRVKSWQAFQRTLDPLGRPRARPEAHPSCEGAPLTVDAIAAQMDD
jgi:hypothetical protein